MFHIFGKVIRRKACYFGIVRKNRSLQVIFVIFGSFFASNMIHTKNDSIARMTCEVSKLDRDMFWHQMNDIYVSLWKSFGKHAGLQLAFARNRHNHSILVCSQLLLRGKFDSQPFGHFVVTPLFFLVNFRVL